MQVKKFNFSFIFLYLLSHLEVTSIKSLMCIIPDLFLTPHFSLPSSMYKMRSYVYIILWLTFTYVYILKIVHTDINSSILFCKTTV